MQGAVTLGRLAWQGQLCHLDGRGYGLSGAEYPGSTGACLRIASLKEQGNTVIQSMLLAAGTIREFKNVGRCWLPVAPASVAVWSLLT